jgi:hypothetical protein
MADPKPATPPSRPVASPAVAKSPSGSGFTASGTVIHQDEHGKRTIIEHGQRLDLPTDTLRKLHRQGAAVRGPAPMPRAAGVEQEPGYVLDEETGLWTDQQGSTHGDAQPHVVETMGEPPPAE